MAPYLLSTFFHIFALFSKTMRLMDFRLTLHNSACPFEELGGTIQVMQIMICPLDGTKHFMDGYFEVAL